ncbi:MAG: glucose-6-phosphate isomerase, partial [Moraxellaceae bacterium]
MAQDQSLSGFEQLKKHADLAKIIHLKDLFAEQANRFEQFNLKVGPILFDYSKQRVTQDVLAALTTFAEDASLRQWIQRLFSGDEVNHTEHRAALHWALRVPDSAPVPEHLDANILAGIHQQIERMGFLVQQLQHGQYRGCTGEVITDVVNIGVGGSDLGPLMVSRALDDYKVATPQHLQLHFVSSMDGSQVSHLLQELRPETTLFIISSKSFTTVDTLYNAETAKSWLQRKLGDDIRVSRCHFIGVSSNQQK